MWAPQLANPFSFLLEINVTSPCPESTNLAYAGCPASFKVRIKPIVRIMAWLSIIKGSSCVVVRFKFLNLGLNVILLFRDHTLVVLQIAIFPANKNSKSAARLHLVVGFLPA